MCQQQANHSCPGNSIPADILERTLADPSLSHDDATNRIIHDMVERNQGLTPQCLGCSRLRWNIEQALEAS